MADRRMLLRVSVASWSPRHEPLFRETYQSLRDLVLQEFRLEEDAASPSVLLQLMKEAMDELAAHYVPALA